MFKFSKILITILTFISIVSSLRLEIPATSNSVPPKCVREFIGENQLVVVSLKVSGSQGDGQILTLRITDSNGNEYRKHKDIVGDSKIAFTAHSSGAYDVCFENALQYTGNGAPRLSREIELEIEVGAAARDWNAIQSAEKLKPVEVQFKKIEEMIDEITNELNYLIAREERLRNTNESTNRRVSNFSVSIIIVLIAVGLWQLQYLRSYFRSKHIL